MGADNIPSRVDNQTIFAEHMNLFRRVLIGDLIPRDSSGAPADIAGSLGSATLRYDAAFIKRLFLGAMASGFSIEEDEGVVSFKMGEETIFTLNSDGLDGAGLKNGSVTQDKLGSREILKANITNRINVTGLENVPVASISVTSRGRPFHARLKGTAGADTYYQYATGGGDLINSSWRFLNGASSLTLITNYLRVQGHTQILGNYCPFSSISALLELPVGTHTINLQLSTGSDTTIDLQGAQLWIYEL